MNKKVFNFIIKILGSLKKEIIWQLIQTTRELIKSQYIEKNLIYHFEPTDMFKIISEKVK